MSRFLRPLALQLSKPNFNASWAPLVGRACFRYLQSVDGNELTLRRRNRARV